MARLVAALPAGDYRVEGFQGDAATAVLGFALATYRFGRYKSKGAAKAWAWLNASAAVTPDHVQTMLIPTWRHRIRLRTDAELEGVTVDAVLASVLQQTRVPI